MIQILHAIVIKKPYNVNIFVYNGDDSVSHTQQLVCTFDRNCMHLTPCHSFCHSCPVIINK